MYAWLRRVTPDLFIAAVVALLLTLALHQLEAYERQRIIADATVAASDSEGLSLDERIEVVGDSIHRSTRLYIPLLIAVGGAAVGLACRLKRWAWLTSLLAVIPALLNGASFYIDLPLRVGLLMSAYGMVAITVAQLSVAVRSRVLAVSGESPRV
jgi:hypothetical protein